MLEQGPDFWCWFDTTQFSYHCVHPIHAKMFSIQMLPYFSQIVPRVCTLVLFILLVGTAEMAAVIITLNWGTVASFPGFVDNAVLLLINVNNMHNNITQ